MTTKFAVRTRPEFDLASERLPDPPKNTDLLEEPDILNTRYILEDYLNELYATLPSNVFISGRASLRMEPGRPRQRDQMFVPDTIVAFDVDVDLIESRNGYVISLIGKPPEFVLEVASQSTATRDETIKLAGYERMRVGECFLFDSTGGRLYSQPLAGYRLVDGVYRPIPVVEDPDGVLNVYSEALDLELCWVEGTLRLRNPRTGRYLRTRREIRRDERIALAQRDAEARRADAAQAARVAAEAENRRLRDMLRRLT